MNFTLIDSGWGKVIDEAVALGEPELHVVCPFIKRSTAERLLAKRPAHIRVVTRFSLADFFNGVSDTSALRLLLDAGATIRGIKGLHAKMYLFGKRRAVVTSANLTDAALARNHEFGFLSDDAAIVARCRSYFDKLWDRAGTNLTNPRIRSWDAELAAALTTGGKPSVRQKFRDEGANVVFDGAEVLVTAVHAETKQAFVKFFGTGSGRANRAQRVLDEVRDSGSHWAAAYPQGKRPTGVQDDALLFTARIVGDPDDIMIYGRARGLAHVPGRDDASQADLQVRPWKQQWPHYVRLHHAEFVAGTLANGVSLNELMVKLTSDAFASTQRNKRAGAGNTAPRLSIRRQPAIELSPEGSAWVNTKLEEAFARFGKLSAADLETLDWPTVPVAGTATGLSPKGLLLFRTLLRFMRADWLKIQDPNTYPNYKTTLLEMGITPYEAGRLGPQFEAEGGRELNEWLRDNSSPALTGLVVNGATKIPGGEYFVSNGQSKDHLDWWRSEMKKAAAKQDWPVV